MLHELLFALFGKTGGSFVETSKGIVVNKDIPLLYPSEVTILDKMCSLGTKYNLFQTFIQKYDGLHPVHDGKVCGMYLKAFANGFSLVLEQYQKDLLKLEQEILTDPQFSLVYVQYQLDKYFLLFPNLEIILKEVTEKGGHDCSILNIIYRHLPSGIPIVNEALNKLLQTCHKPLCKQMISWMIHGLLNDPYREFFILKSEPRERTDLEKHTDRDAYTSLHSLCQFDLCPQFLPVYIPIDLALKILFVGSSVCLFGKRNSQLSASGSLFGEQEATFAVSIYQLQDGVFAQSELSNIVNKIHISANESLWQIVVEESQLLAHLQRLKDFYLLGRGELFSAFIDQASHLLDIPPTEFIEFEVNRVWQSVVATVLGNADGEAEHFYLTIKTSGESWPGSQRDALVIGWSCISLAYQVQWPLNSVLTPQILERYNGVFRFLLSLRQVQQELQQCWMLLMRCQRSSLNRQATTLWQLWTHMMFLINNLQYHLQIEVLESEFNQLVKTIQTKRDFEEVLVKHNSFLTIIMKSTFLTNKPVHFCLVEIMSCCRRFCSWVAAFSRETPQVQANLGTIIVSFRRHSMFLFKNLQVVQPHLYMKFDYNRYLSATGVLYFGGTDSV